MNTTQTETEQAIAGFTASLSVYRAREIARPGLWTEEVRDCEIAIARLCAGLGLTRMQRGLPSDGSEVRS